MSPEELIEKYRRLPDFHLTRIMGAWVAIVAGTVVEVDRSQALEHCPLQSLLSGADVEAYAAEKIAELGQFTPQREVWRSTLGVPFGTSEMFLYALRKGVIDCAITVCDGAGTVVTTVPEVAQGIGARMNGLFYTSPIREVQEKLLAHGCLLLDGARIDQAAGLRKAIAAGHRRIAVTVNGRFGERLADLRSLERDAGVAVTIAAVCTTGITEERADELVGASDLAWTCASRPMRERGSRARLQVTHGIPIFVYTPRGLELLAAYSDEAGAETLRSLDPHKRYLLASSGSDTRVRLGESILRLVETRLPVRSRNEPRPLR